MSTTANWSYTNVATVWPLQDTGDGWGDPVPKYGEPYQIACTWKGGGEKMTNNDGREFVSRMEFYHEDPRVKYGDWIGRGTLQAHERVSHGDPIQSHTEYDMSPFGEQPDYRSAT